MSLEPGRMLLHYRLVEPLGRGGMGVVWKAVDTTLGREVAIKFLPEAFAVDPDRLARFEREAKVLASLNHTNVAAVYGFHEDGGVRFLAMELVPGRSLAEEIAHGIAPARMVELASAIADGLAAAHRKRVIHRDLKPENVMIDEEGRPKILDFGLAKLGAIVATPSPDAPTISSPATATRQGTLVGTVAYMSPEQAQGKPIDLRSDVFSLGIVLYEMATGRRPFRGDNDISILTSILRDTPAPIAEVAPAAPPPLGRIVGRCLEKEPAKRYADASGVRDDLRALRERLVSASSATPLRRRPTRAQGIVLAAVAAIAIVAAGALWHRHTARLRWVRDVALPKLESTVDRIQALEEGRESWDAFVLARKIEAIFADEPLVGRLRPKFERPITIDSDPPGATVSIRYYDDPHAPPIVLGTTPLHKVPYPQGFTRLHLALAGRVPDDDIVWNYQVPGGRSLRYKLEEPGAIPDDMTYVPAAKFPLFLPGLDNLAPEATAPFLIDRHEVTNRDYKKFVDAGGYADPKYWTVPFVDGGKTLSFGDAMARFVDRTGRPGPATWEVGTYPDGKDDYPVSGVSWYEAAAYAAWAKKRLPTIFQWNLVAYTVASSRIIPMANLGREKGPVPVGTTGSANRYGAVDLAGNVREWVWNESGPADGRFILGGGWNDPDYAFADAYAQPPFDRSPTNGFRCIREVGDEPNLAALERKVNRPVRDFMKEKPVPDAVFAQYLRQFAYDKTPLHAKIEEEKEMPEGLRQKITFDAAYGGERMMAYLFLPKEGKPPYQVVVYFPGSGAVDMRSSANLGPGLVDFLVKTGRAVIFPIYKGTYERGGDLRTDYPAPTARYKDYVIMWAKDLARSIDYVETRKDLDASKIAYYGVSWGGRMGSILPAIEKRIKVNVLYVAGLGFQRALPEVDEINYVGRVKQPTLILNGEMDFYFPPETSQKPLYELLGTPAADKKRLVYPGGHSVPRTEMIKQSLAWLDKYLGPVRGTASAP